MIKVIASLASGLVVVGLLCSGASAQATLNSVKQKGLLTCGTSSGSIGFGMPDSQGSWTGFDVDFCRAMAAAIFDDPNKVVDYGQTGRVRLTTLTKELFIPGFLERDEGEREKPSAKYAWDGVSGVRPYRAFAATTTVGVY